jgi:hypothetical protein
MYEDSVIVLDVIQRSFLTNAATAAMFTPVQVNFEWLLLSSSSPASFRLEIKNTV